MTTTCDPKKADEYPDGFETERATFPWQMFHDLLSVEEGNFVFSPASIQQGFGLIYAGADGDTAKLLEDVLYDGARNRKQIFEFEKKRTANLKLEEGPKQRYKASVMRTANRLFLAKGVRIRTSFLQEACDVFQADAVAVDFRNNLDQEVDNINKWMADKTMGAIKKIVSAKDLKRPASAMLSILVNAIYFTSNWLNEFKLSDENFYLPSKPEHSSKPTSAASTKQKIRVRMFGNRGLILRYTKSKSLPAEIAVLPYAASRVNMVIILPKKNVDVDEVCRELTMETWSALRSETSKVFASVKVPKFSITTHPNLNAVGGAWGSMMAGLKEPDFSRMVDSENNDVLPITDVFHVAWIEVDERGTTAGAATAVAVRLTSAASEPKVNFICNRPFIFVIERNWQPIFIGKLLKP